MLAKLSNRFCLDCGFDTRDLGEYYMVHDKLWHEAVPNVSGQLCIGCLENRLGRTLCKFDFTDCALNQLAIKYPYSTRLLSRLG